MPASLTGDGTSIPIVRTRVFLLDGDLFRLTPAGSGVFLKQFSMCMMPVTETCRGAGRLPFHKGAARGELLERCESVFDSLYCYSCIPRGVYLSRVTHFLQLRLPAPLLSRGTFAASRGVLNAGFISPLNHPSPDHCLTYWSFLFTFSAAPCFTELALVLTSRRDLRVKLTWAISRVPTPMVSAGPLCRAQNRSSGVPWPVRVERLASSV